MNAPEIWLSVITGVIVLMWLAYLATMSRPVVRKTMIALTLLLIDAWLWDLALAPHFAVRWMIAPLIIINAVAALGLVQGTTGFRMRGGPDDRMAMSDPTYGRAAAGFDEPYRG